MKSNSEVKSKPSLWPYVLSHRSSHVPPIVKISKTSRTDINGGFAYAHEYFRSRDRYAATFLDGGDKLHPALVYFGGIDAEELNELKPCMNSNGNARTEVLRREEEDDALDNRDKRPNEHKHDTSHHHTNTLYLPPTTISRLSSVDVFMLYLQYIAISKLSCQTLADMISKIAESLGDSVVAVSVVVLLPFIVAKMYTKVLEGVTVGDTSSIRSGILVLFSRHSSELMTLLMFLVGANTIARFILSEYSLVKKKAESMDAYHSDRAKKKSFTAMEMFEYRVDYYFSTSKWAKVALLLSITFMLIAVGASLLAVFLDDHSISNATWIAWTYVAVSSSYHYVLRLLFVNDSISCIHFSCVFFK